MSTALQITRSSIIFNVSPVRLDPILDLLKAASQNLKYPRLLAMTKDGVEVDLVLGKNDIVWVTDHRQKAWNDRFGKEMKLYYGKIQNGVFASSHLCPAGVFEALQDFAQNPLEAAKLYGTLTGNCCFCGRELTDNKAGRSVEVGYGPICAEKWGLPWG